MVKKDRKWQEGRNSGMCIFNSGNIESRAIRYFAYGGSTVVVIFPKDMIA